ncbi:MULTISPECIES: hypothetical protein [Rahnella]|uniref:Uncharacterized protein n=1 Tax=Rahnella laticis TaxID=2787622 RepID=A0ABS0DZ54_9GAMM|nr:MULTISPECIES: hypothetical protein [Rahnella]MBF7978133.1 hypothetical protein [Rahnella laticis]MBF7998150.1 hypothetical protein [Rahnella sp. LAC-M12]
MTIELAGIGIALASYEYEINGTEGRTVVLKSIEAMADGNDDYIYAVEVFDEMENKIDRQVFEDFAQASVLYKEFRALNDL